jgi:hypothetical protein
VRPPPAHSLNQGRMSCLHCHFGELSKEQPNCGFDRLKTNGLERQSEWGSNMAGAESSMGPGCLDSVGTPQWHRRVAWRSVSANAVFREVCRFSVFRVELAPVSIPGWRDHIP